MAVHEQADRVAQKARDSPPVAKVGMLALAVFAAGGIYVSFRLPHHIALAPAAVLLGLSALLLVGNLFTLTRVRGLALDRFLESGYWAMLACLPIAGLIVYELVRDHVSGGPLLMLTLTVAVYAVHVPMLIGFAVARYYHPIKVLSAGPSAAGA